MAEINWKTARSYARIGGDVRDCVHLAKAFLVLDALVEEMVAVIENTSGIDHETEALIARAKETRGG